MKGSFFTGANMAEGTAKDGSNNKQSGVRRAEAFAKLIRGKGGKKIFWMIAVAVYVCNWVVSCPYFHLLHLTPRRLVPSVIRFPKLIISMLFTCAFETALYGEQYNVGLFHLGNK